MDKEEDKVRDAWEAKVSDRREIVSAPHAEPLLLTTEAFPVTTSPVRNAEQK